MKYKRYKRKSILNFIDLIKYPMLTDKTNRLVQFRQYLFLVDPRLTKIDIKTTIEYLFNIKVKSVNTSHCPPRLKRVGKFLGNRTSYKKAFITLVKGDFINLFSES